MQRFVSATLCLTALLLPFSIAASNVLFALLLLLTLLSGMWWQGAKAAYQAWPIFFHFWAAYVLLMLLGLLWSLDVDWGLKILPQYWGWFLLPVFVFALKEKLWRNRFMLALSAGLFFQLLACIAQSWGIELPVGNGSHKFDPAGFIGHIGFGLLYGIWAAWLIHWGYVQTGERRWSWFAWGCAFASTWMIFIVQGRSGYIEAACLLLFIFWRLFLQQQGWRLLLWLLPFALLAALFLSQGGASARMLSTWHSLNAYQQGNFAAAEERVSLMYAGFHSWINHPFFGGGTGSFPVLAERLQQQQPELGLHYSWNMEAPSSPHNFYLMVLARWGPLGLLVLLGIFYSWYKKGWNANWKHSSGSMLTLSAIGISVHAMTSLPFEEYYSSIYGMAWCAAGLAGVISEESGEVKEEPHSA